MINQGLFYFDWLMDHKAEFELLVMKKLGQQESEKIDCPAHDCFVLLEHLPSTTFMPFSRSIETLSCCGTSGLAKST